MKQKEIEQLESLIVKWENTAAQKRYEAKITSAEEIAIIALTTATAITDCITQLEEFLAGARTT